MRYGRYDMKRSEEPRVGAFSACPFCGERKRLIAWYNTRRLMCKCRCATGHCSPIHPKCRFYDKGMCNEIKEVR